MDDGCVRKGIYVADPHNPFFRRLVQSDLNQAKATRLSLDVKDYDALLVQSVLGHAQEKHKIFHENGAQFPEATLSDVIIAAGLDLAEIKKQRQEKIDNVREWIEQAKQGSLDRLVLKGKPLLGVELLKDYVVDPEYVLCGMILAGLMDNYEWRQNTVAHYDAKTIDGRELVIGGGTSVLLDKEKLIEWKPFAIEELAESEATLELWLELEERGIITDADNPHAEVIYIRKKKGLGTSDDAAFILAGELYNSKSKNKSNLAARSAFLGAFVVDGVDTYDKCVTHPVESGYDELMGRELRKALPDLVSKETIYSLIYHAAKGNAGYVVSSSHKRLIEFQEMAKPRQPTLLHHLRFMEEGKGPDSSFKVGFERQSSQEFYASVKGRVNNLKAKE